MNKSAEIYIPYQGELLAGVDEVGRGPLFGAVIAAAVILPKSHTIEGLTDSKKLTEKKRLVLIEQIKQQAIAYALGRVEASEIDAINILQASLLAMKRAVDGLAVTPEYVVVDGNQSPKLTLPVQTIIKGDGLIESISAASILAKVVRDQEMVELDKQFPGYGFAQHKGYPTKQHIDAIQRLGVTAMHRRSFKPVARACLQASS